LIPSSAAAFVWFQYRMDSSDVVRQRLGHTRGRCATIVLVWTVFQPHLFLRDEAA
jgi:hypothetical protein